MANPTKYDVGWFTDADELSEQTGLGYRDQAQVQAATRLVDAFARRGGSGVFTKLERAKIAAGLKKRLANFNSFNQGDTWLCGIATFIRVWAHDFPVQYVQLATDLYEKGEGRLTNQPKYAGKAIKPSQALRDSPPGKLSDGKEFDHADWIVLASVREAFNSVFDYTANEGIFRIKAWNFPRDVEGEFKAAGYQKIVNKADGLKCQGYDNLMAATRLYESGWRVILLINSRLLSRDKKQVAGSALLYHSNHWIGLNQAITISTFNGQNRVLPFSVYSWDGLYTVPRWNEPLPLSTFINSYFGFVAGHV